jgi:DNA-binding SARP family transcriptional activator
VARIGQIGLLGPLTLVSDDGTDLRAPAAPKERAVLEFLAVRPSATVLVSELVDALWGEDPPRSAIKTIQTYISALRALLSPGAILTCPGGYQLSIRPEGVDAVRFERDIHAGHDLIAGGDLHSAVTHLTDGLDLWRGEPLFDLSESLVGRAEAARLSELRRSGEECLAEARMALGGHSALIGDLEAAVTAEPLRERRWAQLMLALYRSGRQADALRAFQRLRRVLNEELGLEPSNETCALENAILAHDPSLALPTHPAMSTEVREEVSADSFRANLIAASRKSAHRRPMGRPASLPFVGRSEVLAELSAFAGRANSTTNGHALILVSGAAGCGKTRLLEEFIDQANAEANIVVFTSAEDDDVLPYRPFVDLVRHFLTAPSADDSLMEMGNLVFDLAPLVPGAPRLQTPVNDVGLARMRLFDAVVELSGLASRQNPVVLIVDDAHRMGKETGALLHLLAERSEEEQLSIILAARNDDESWSQGFADFLRRHTPAVIRVGPLSEPEVEVLAGRLTAFEMRTALSSRVLLSQSGGVPLVLDAILRAPVRGDNFAGPVDIARVIADRTASLSASTQEVLQVAAVMGSAATPTLISEVTGRDRQVVQAALNTVVAEGGLLEQRPLDGGYGWHHALIREAVLDTVDQRPLEGLREAVSSAFANQGAVLQAARQAVEVLHLNAKRLLPILVAGVDEAIEALAFDLAESLCRQGLELGAEATEPATAVELLNRLGRCRAYIGRRRDAEQAWEEAARVARAIDDADLIGETALASDLYARSTVDFPLRWKLLNEALPFLDAMAVPLRVRVLAGWIDEASLSRHGVSAPELVARSIELANTQRDGRLLATALSAAHNARRAVQQVPLDVSRQLCGTADLVADSHWQAQARLAALIDTVTVGEVDQAAQHLSRYLGAVHLESSPRALWEASMVESTWALLKGDIEQSDQRAQQAADLGQRYGIEDADLAFGIHLFFRAFHEGTLGALVEPLSRYADDHPEIPAWRAGAGLARAALADLEGATATRHAVLPLILNPGVDAAWPVAACICAQLCWETAADERHTRPLYEMLDRYQGRVAVIGRFVGECGPISRYLGLLAGTFNKEISIRHLHEADVLSERFGAALWSRRVRSDLDELPGRFRQARSG